MAKKELLIGHKYALSHLTACLIVKFNMTTEVFIGRY